MVSAAKQLLGKELVDGWRVVSEFELADAPTGATFSVGYIAEREGQRAFVKALDYSKAAEPGVNTIDELRRMTTEFAFERDLLEACNARRMDKVVKAIGRGQIVLGPGLDGTVDYLLFELADGDVRKHMERSSALNAAWVFRCLHHIATGLMQLHKGNIAHQDVKPSNVLVFNGQLSKVGDLGRASLRGVDGPHDRRPVPGARSYAPPELLYSEVSTEWAARRFGCDLYLLGSMVVFLFAQVSMTHAVQAELPEEFRYYRYRGFFRDLLPHLRDAMGRVIERCGHSVPSEYRDSVLRILRETCEPDPIRRGHPKNVLAAGVNQYSVERYVSEFNVLAHRATNRVRR